MLIASGCLSRFRVRAVDGEIGRIHDLQVDDLRWVVRDIVVDVGHWLTGHLVLIRPTVVLNPDRDHHTIDVRLTAEQIADAPSVESHPTVARQHSVEPYHYLGLPLLLSGFESWTPSFAVAGVAEGHASQFRFSDPHLRSLRALSHYAIEARDGEAGYVEDWIVDLETWCARYAVVKTGVGLARRDVLVPVHELGPVSWSARCVYADLPRRAIIHAPEYSRASLPDADYEIRLHRWFGDPTDADDAAGRSRESANVRALTAKRDLGRG